MEIYCPRCGYKPTQRDRWICKPGCHNVWNTFETQGQCPRCFKWWKETVCPTCRQWSPHPDWYHGGDIPLFEEDQELELVR
jgi:hypothetical protein